MLPEDRFPNRLRKVQRTGLEIARSLGEFGPKVGLGRPRRAMLADFQFTFFTPFNRPTNWVGINWQDEYIRTHLYGLRISHAQGTCLDVLWDCDTSTVRMFRDPRRDGWDLRLRRLWKDVRHSISRPPPIQIPRGGS
jgi:hypothetical protein